MIDVIKKNREEHRSLFERAQVGFRKRVIERLDEMLEAARKNIRYDLYVSLQPPVDQTNEYDMVLQMLEMSVEDEIELTHQEFKNYVMDDWSWKAQTTTLNASYV